MATITDDMDRISQLPEPIMEKILSRLPGQDAVCMSLLSKTWKSLWDSLPQSHFDFVHSGTSSAEMFVNYVDESLSILHHENEGNPKSIIYFRLTVEREANISDHHHVDHWMKLISKHYVKRLLFDFSFLDDYVKYKFPPARLDFGSLVVLDLEQCRLMGDFVHGDTRFRCLKELKLVRVDLNGLAEELLSRCPSLVNLELRFCSNNQEISVSGLTKLKKFVIEVNQYAYGRPEREPFCCSKIEAVSLETLHYLRSRTLSILLHGDIFCPNLKELSIHIPVPAMPRGVEKYYVTKYIIPQFPFLKKLIISCSYFFCETVLEVSSHRLKSLVVSGYCKINLKTPNLLYCKLGDYKVPPSILSKYRKQQILVNAKRRTTTPLRG